MTSAVGPEGAFGALWAGAGAACGAGCSATAAVQGSAGSGASFDSLRPTGYSASCGGRVSTFATLARCLCALPSFLAFGAGGLGRLSRLLGLSHGAEA